MKVRKAELKDLDNVVQLFRGAIELMNKQNINQWDEIYPNEEDFRKDILKKEMYLYEDNEKIYSVFVLNKEFDDEYNKAAWQFPNSNFIILHRLCVNAEVQNKGIGTKTMKLIEEIASAKNIESIRLDTFSENPFSCKLYEKIGFKKTGEANWRKGLFYLYEKRI